MTPKQIETIRKTAAEQTKGSAQGRPFCYLESKTRRAYNMPKAKAPTNGS